jgi:membrane protein YdbS with pleckstrin-like domain
MNQKKSIFKDLTIGKRILLIIVSVAIIISCINDAWLHLAISDQATQLFGSLAISLFLLIFKDWNKRYNKILAWVYRIFVVLTFIFAIDISSIGYDINKNHNYLPLSLIIICCICVLSLLIISFEKVRLKMKHEFTLSAILFTTAALSLAATYLL